MLKTMKKIQKTKIVQQKLNKIIQEKTKNNKEIIKNHQEYSVSVTFFHARIYEHKKQKKAFQKNIIPSSTQIHSRIMNKKTVKKLNDKKEGEKEREGEREQSADFPVTLFVQVPAGQ